MTDKPVMKEEHFRRGVFVIDWRDMKRLAIAEAMSRAGLTDLGRVGTAVRYEDATEGSPPYRIGTKMIVTLIEDLMQSEEIGDD